MLTLALLEMVVFWRKLTFNLKGEARCHVPLYLRWKTDWQLTGNEEAAK